jgi:predicted nucleic acid-binding protein
LIAYADTTFLVSLYGRDANSRVARQLLPSQPVFLVTPLGGAEFVNAVESLVFRNYWSRSEASAVMDRFLEQRSSGVFRAVPFVSEMWDKAAELSRKHTAAIGTRTLDVLHVAAVLLLKPDVFFTFDKRQAKLAKALGVKIAPI